MCVCVCHIDDYDDVYVCICNVYTCPGDSTFQTNPSQTNIAALLERVPKGNKGLDHAICPHFEGHTVSNKNLACRVLDLSVSLWKSRLFRFRWLYSPEREKGRSFLAMKRHINSRYQNIFFSCFFFTFFCFFSLLLFSVRCLRV